jgi:cytochrome P450
LVRAKIKWRDNQRTHGLQRFVLTSFNNRQKVWANCLAFFQGPEWKLVRSFLQTDLFSPKSAKRYVPSIIEAADNCSKAAGHYQSDLKVFLDYASFEMFCSIMFGRQLNIVDPTKERDPAALSFAETVVKALSTSSALNQNVTAYA